MYWTVSLYLLGGLVVLWYSGVAEVLAYGYLCLVGLLVLAMIEQAIAINEQEIEEDDAL